SKNRSTCFDVCYSDIRCRTTAANIKRCELCVVGKFESRVCLVPTRCLKVRDHHDLFLPGGFQFRQQRLRAPQCLFIISSIPTGVKTPDAETQASLVLSEAVDDRIALVEA